MLLLRGGIAAAILIAFFIGRASVKNPEPEIEEPPRLRPPRLSALPGARSRQTDPAQGNASPASAELVRAMNNHRGIREFLTTSMFDGQGITDLVADWLRMDPDGAIAWLASSGDRAEAFAFIFMLWGSADPLAAEAWLNAKAGAEEFQYAAMGMALSFVEQGETEQALQWIASVSDPLAIAQFWGGFDESLYAKNPGLITERLAASGLPVEARSALLARWEIDRRGSHAKRNAQNLASVYSSAVAAGGVFESDSHEGVVRELLEGTYGSDSFSTTFFQAPNMSAAEIEAALDYLDGSDGSLSYHSPRGGRTVDPVADLEDSGLPEEILQPIREYHRQRAIARASRNARNLASIYQSALAAGADIPGSTTAEIVQQIVGGVTGAGQFETTTFQMPNMSAEEIDAALQNLHIADGRMAFNPGE